MEATRRDFEEFLKYEGGKKFPKEILEVLELVYEDIRNRRSKRLVPQDFGENLPGDINLIPRKEEGSCRKLLAAVCYYDDNIDTRLRKCLDHAAIKCDGVNREVYFLSTKWNSAVVDKYIGYIQSLRHNGVEVNMLYITRNGVVRMPL